MSRKYNNTRFLKDCEFTDHGEIVLDTWIPGVSNYDLEHGIMIEHIPSGQIYLNLLDASNGTQTNVGLIIKALNNRGKERENYRVFNHDMTHMFSQGVLELEQYSETFDATKIDRENLGFETYQVLSNFLNEMDEADLTEYEVMENSPLKYYNLYFDDYIEFTSVSQASKVLKIHPTDILKSINGNSPLAGRFVLER